MKRERDKKRRKNGKKKGEEGNIVREREKSTLGKYNVQFYVTSCKIIRISKRFTLHLESLSHFK